MNNFVTFLIAFFIAAVTILIIVSETKKRKNGCSCGCSGCAMKDTCHGKLEKKKS